MMTVREKLFLFLPALALVFLVLFGFLLARQLFTFEEGYLKDVKIELETHSDALANAFRHALATNDTAAIQTLCATYEPYPLRVTLIAQDGTVLAESQHELVELENHAERPEFLKAAAGVPVHEERFSVTEQCWTLYYARQLTVDGHNYVLRVSTATRGMTAVFERVKKNIVLAVLFGVIITALIGLYLFRRVYIPLTHLHRAACAITEGEQEVKITIPSGGILRDLSRDIDMMQFSLRAKIGELTAERNERDQLLEKMRKLESFRKEFIANVSHEIKTPLTCISGAVESLTLLPENDREKQAQCLAILQTHAKRLEALVEDILSLAALEQREREIESHFEPVRADVCAGNAVSLCAEHAKASGIKLTLEKLDSVTFYGDGKHIEQALINLIENAIRYSQGKTIAVRAEKEGETVRFSVRDDGIGIAEEHHARLFERFYRVHKERSRKLGGTGLGLAIVKHIALLHNGKVALKSRPGQGAEFTITLPLGNAQNEA